MSQAPGIARIKTKNTPVICLRIFPSGTIYAYNMNGSKTPGGLKVR